MTTNDDFTLTLEEASSFMRDVLGLDPPTPAQLPVESREAYIGDFLRAMFHRLPFQTVVAIATPKERRHLPTAAEIKRDAFAGLGGLCYTLNTFIWMLLNGLGFNVSLVTSGQRGQKDDHVCVIAHDLTFKGSKHLVDLGCSYPIFRPIPLDFQGSASPEYRDSFLRYRFVREGDFVTRYQHAKGNSAIGKIPHEESVDDDGWYEFFRTDVENPVDVAHFRDIMTVIYTDSDMSPAPFLSSVRCVAYPNGRFVAIKDTTLLVEDEGGVVRKTYLRSLEEVVAAFVRYFPQLPQDMVKAALADENVKLDFTKQL